MENAFHQKWIVTYLSPGVCVCVCVCDTNERKVRQIKEENIKHTHMYFCSYSIMFTFIDKLDSQEIRPWCDGKCLPSKAVCHIFESGNQPLQKN